MKMHSLFLLIVIILVSACASQPTATPWSTSVVTSFAPAILATSTIMPTSDPSTLPTFSFNSTPFPTPTSVGPGPFNRVAGIDEIFPESEWARLDSALDGTAWLLTDKGVARVSDSGWTIYLSGYEGYLIGMDATDQAWVISELGDFISAWDGTNWTKYSSESGWTIVNDPQSFNGAYLDRNTNNFAELPGQIWLSTREDVRLFDGIRWKIFTPEEMNMAPRTRDVSSVPPILPILEVEAIQSTGEVWVGECDSEPFSLPHDGSGARWFDGISWRGKSTPVDSGCVHSIQEDKAGNIWMAVNYSLWRFTPSTQEWVIFTLTEFSANSQSFIIGLAISDAGEPWLITLPCGGGGGCGSRTLYHLVDRVWRPVGSMINPRAVSIDPEGNTWLLPFHGESGFYLIVDNYPQPVSDLIVNDWAMDPTGRIWVIGKAGQEDKESIWLAVP